MSLFDIVRDGVFGSSSDPVIAMIITIGAIVVTVTLILATFRLINALGKKFAG